MTAVIEHEDDMEELEIKACAQRGRETGQRLETGGDVANALTTVQKDSMVMEPRILTPRRTDEAKELRKQGVERFAARRLEPKDDGSSNTITSVQKDNLLYEPRVSVHPLSHAKEFRGEDNFKEVSPALRATDYKCPHVVREERNGTMFNGRFISEHSGVCTNDSEEFFRGELPGMSRTIKAEKVDAGTCVSHRGEYRIRKLTPRECFRLMDVDDHDIDKIQAADISKSQQYKMAGNSICVNPLYFIFRNMFIDEYKKKRTGQLTLF
jgi:site-specific DNA-cytosine methylase